MIDQDKLLLFSPEEILFTVKCSAPTTCASYIGQHIGVSVASVPLNLKDLMENQDDAVLGLNDSAIKRNVVRKCL